MPKIIQLKLSAEQRAELEVVRDRHPQPHMREKAAALLRIADGQRAAQVARQGILKPRKEDTIYRWLERYQAEGVVGLLVRRGRGRKAAFSPSVRD